MMETTITEEAMDMKNTMKRLLAVLLAAVLLNAAGLA